MNRLAVRLVVSHLLVALLGGVATFVVVRLLAPALFDEQMRMGQMGQGNPGQATPGQGGPGQATPGQGGPGQGGLGHGPGMGPGGQLRQQFADAVTQALAVGVVVGLLAAAVFGALAAYRLVRPLEAVRRATRAIAGGRYAVPVPAPRERELADLAHDVTTLGAALAQTEATRMRLIGEVAHEMRTPLTVIDGYVEGMIDGVLPTSPERLGQVSVETRRLRRLAGDLSMLSRSGEGRLALRRAEVDLVEVVTAATERLRPQVEDAGLALEVRTPAAPVPVTVDADRVAQVVTNLVGNAVRATQSGGRVEVVVGTDGADALVRVHDDGEGLAADDLTRVFERFYRVPGRRRDPGAGDTGSGIGLTIARDIARAHEGELTAASGGAGRGATFTMRLPLTR